MSKRTWLILSYFANVDGMAPSVHIDNRIQELRRRGVRVILVTSLASPPGNEDTYRIPSFLPSGFRYEIRRIFLRKPKTIVMRAAKGAIMVMLLPFYALEKVVFPFDANWSWYLSAGGTTLRLARRFRPEVIYSTGGPVTAHIAGQRVAKETETPWIAEFQDPLRTGSSERNARESAMHRKTEQLVADNADVVIYLTKKLLGSTMERLSFKGTVEAIYAGAPPFHPSPRTDSVKNTERLTLVHIGTLSSTRNLKGLLAGLDILKDMDPDVLDHLGIYQYGHADKHVETSSRQYPEHVHLGGRVSHEEALEIMESSDVLLLVQDISDISCETIPSKVYEYLHSGCPILGLVYRNPELTRILEDHGHISVEVDDPPAIALALIDLVDRWNKGKLTEEIRSSDLTVANAVDKLEELAESLAGRVTHGP